VVVYIAICIGFGIWTALVGRSKGSSAWIWFVIGAVVPVIGLIAAVLYRYETDELRRQCPGCGKTVPLHDALCTRCGTELDFPDVAIEPESRARAGA
jgi:hypothetical protein